MFTISSVLKQIVLFRLIRSIFFYKCVHRIKTLENAYLFLIVYCQIFKFYII